MRVFKLGSILVIIDIKKRFFFIGAGEHKGQKLEELLKRVGYYD